jgi:mono/diheme cytochrome c family protein
MRRKTVVKVITVPAILMVLAFTAARIGLTALNDPGRVETYLATKAKHLLVPNSARAGIPSAPANNEQSRGEGEKLYAAECSTCHGLDGRPTDAGRWMYPRAVDLTSAEGQGWSDSQLFWIVKNGIKLSGMPAFGRVENDEHIWNLVHYMRSLSPSLQQASGSSPK